MSEYFLKDYPAGTDLLNWYSQNKTDRILEVNNHLHTPYSFSAFRNVEQIFDMAVNEGISVLGINDFYVADGYETFYKHSLRSRIFPLFNIEFIGLLAEEQKNDIRVNDPNNPGRTYFCGKGLHYPFELEPQYECLLRNIRYESQMQVKEMIEKANLLLHKLDPGMTLKYSEVKRLYAKDLVRERHIARAIRECIFSRYTTDKERAGSLKNLYNGRDSKVNPGDETALENEIRANLLKAGGKAFIQEDPEAFLPIPQIIDIILNAGGIPCYPVLLDDQEGNCTEYETDMQLLLNELEIRNICCIELIPGRNDPTLLKEFVTFFHENKFIITFGTEHNTPDLKPVSVTARGNMPLDKELKQISWEGACVIAAHQYLHAQGEEGYVKLDGQANRQYLDKFIELGKAVIEKFLTG
jgi:hypothetical protein